MSKLTKTLVGLLCATITIGAFAGGLAIANNIYESHYSEIVTAQDSEIDLIKDKNNELQNQLTENKEIIESLQEAVSNLQNQLNRDPSKTYLDDILGVYDFTSFKTTTATLILGQESRIFSGVYLLNSDFSIIKIYSENYIFDNVVELSNGNLMILASINNRKILVYDITTKQITQFDTNRNYSDSQLYTLSNGNIIIPSVYGEAEFYLYELETNELTGISDNGYYFFEISNDKVLVSNFRSDGISILNPETKQVVEIYSEGSYWNGFVKLDDGNVLIASSQIDNSLLIYNPNLNSFTTIETITLEGWKTFYKLMDGNVLIGTSQGEGFYLFNATTNEVSQIYDEGTNWGSFYQMQNGNVIMSCHVSDIVFRGIYLYNPTTNEVSKIYMTGNYWDTFVEDENGVTISSSVMTGQNPVYYDFETGTCEILEDATVLAVA